VPTTTTTTTLPPAKKVTLCHVDGAKPKTLRISPNAVPAHIRHGDTLGACPE
jgi:hypothetical protein